MNTDQWASHDQFTSFVKEPWGFNRPENRKEDSLLSKATFAEWPNTTSDFALRRGVAPTGKLATHHKSRIETGRGKGMDSLASPLTVTKTPVSTNQPSFAISDVQLRASVEIRPAGGCVRRANTVAHGAPLSAPKGRAAARHSADDVTAAYTLLQKQAAARECGSPKSTARTCAPTKLPARDAGVAELPRVQRNEQIQGQNTSNGELPEGRAAASSNWSVTNIGFNDIKSETRSRTERENKDGYVIAAFASQDADKSYLAEAAHFRFRYPHTLGRIAALSHIRSDRINARKDRESAMNNRGHNK